MANKQRMEWLDAMRGFTMMLVVSYHVAQMGFGESEKLSASLPFLVLFRMPLFFFVSGFLAYKSRFVWTAASFASLTLKKLKVQVIPALVFLCVFLIFKAKTPFPDAFLHAMKSPTKDGYWFTWVLLQMFVIYYVVAALAQRLGSRNASPESGGKKGSHVPVVILWVAALVAYLSLFMPVTFGKWYKTDFMMYSSFYETLKFFHFFLMGNIVHRYWDRVQRLFDSRWFFPVVATLALLSCADFFKWHTLTGQWTNLPKTTAMYTLMLMVLMVFRHYGECLTQDKKIGYALQYIGTRTLDIYLLHFILLPRIPEVGKWLNAHQPNFVIDITLSMSMALIVIAFCLLVSNVLRTSPLLKEWLFGRKS